MEPKLLVRSDCLLAEGPIWNSLSHKLTWVDIVNGNIHEYWPADKKHNLIYVNEMVGAVALCKNGDYIAALKSGLAYIKKNDHSIVLIANPEEHLPNNRFNDGKCDPSGRFWFGSMSLSEEPKVASLYTFENPETIEKKLGGITISNGLAWTEDTKTMYYIDTPTMQVCAFDFNDATGGISNKRTVITIPEEEGYPDGMTIDVEGKLWIAHWDGWQVARWDPVNGQKMLSIKLPVARITSCTFGGEDLANLYITSAKVGLSKEELEQQPLAGSIFVVENCGYQGLKNQQFKNS